jgi:hypothetical protein
VLLGDAATEVISILTGVAGVVAAYGAVLIAFHTMRNKERMAADHELREVTRLLGLERRDRIASEDRAFKLTLLAVQHGVAVPPELLEPIKEEYADDAAERDSDEDIPERGHRWGRRRRADRDVGHDGPDGGLPAGQGGGSEGGDG